MKNLLLRLISAWLLILPIYGQNAENSCGSIKIDAPSIVFTDRDSFSAGAHYVGNTEKSNFNWLIIGDVHLLRIQNAQNIELERKFFSSKGLITLVAEDLDENCKNPAISRISVVEPAGSPLILDTFGPIGINDKKLRIDMVLEQFKKQTEADLLIGVHFNVRSNRRSWISVVKPVSDHLQKRKTDLRKVTFLVCESDSELYKFEVIPKNLLNGYETECMLIRAEDVDKIVKFS